MKKHNKVSTFGLIVLVFICQCNLSQNIEKPLNVETRKQERLSDGTWQTVSTIQEWKPSETCVIIIDMWDQHWCKGAIKRAAVLVPRMNTVNKSLRERGVFIIHAPSGTVDFYKDTPQRKRIQSASSYTGAEDYKDWFHLDPEKEPKLPIGGSGHGCGCTPKCKVDYIWTRQIDTIEIMENDGISDSGIEIFNYFEQNEIKNVIIMGVHANACILGRPFGIRALARQGRNVVIVRDLTDAIFNPEMPPYVSQDKGTELVIDHIEKYWCPSVESASLLR